MNFSLDLYDAFGLGLYIASAFFVALFVFAKLGKKKKYFWMSFIGGAFGINIATVHYICKMRHLSLGNLIFG